MKGLILTHMGKREEGLELVKKGVRLDLTSHIVWHVFGLIQKGEKNYEEALKSYTQALRFDKVSRNWAPPQQGLRLCSYISRVPMLLAASTSDPIVNCQSVRDYAISFIFSAMSTLQVKFKDLITFPIPPLN